jgi:hypothetical protein
MTRTTRANRLGTALPQAIHRSRGIPRGPSFRARNHRLSIGVPYVKPIGHVPLSLGIVRGVRIKPRATVLIRIACLEAV